MQFKLFGWLSHPAPRVDATPPPARDPQPPSAPCPPCSGHCFQGRACPSSPTADKTLLESQLDRAKSLALAHNMAAVAGEITTQLAP